MIVALRGVVFHKEPNVVYIDVNGVVYEVFISLQCYALIKSENITIFTSHIIREDAQLLYGFIDKNEKILFERLIKINGVGPKVAMAICSTYTPLEFSSIVSSGDVKAVQKVVGIGPKSAGRILVELNGFDISMLETPTSGASKTLMEASMALESLGYKKDVIAKVLAKCKSDDTASLVKEALKQLQTI